MPFPGRSGPSRATPNNVQCQKCLKRGHYSYECKAAPQERPYIARPSRTQQLFNPKLLPKLSNAVPDDVLQLQNKKGVADEELAKIEAERRRKRELEKDDDDDGSPPPSSKKRSASFDSVSTISTRSPSPPPAARSRSPRTERPQEARANYRDPSPRRTHGRRGSFSSSNRVSSKPSESQRRHHGSRFTPDRRSPSPLPEREFRRDTRDDPRDYERATEIMRSRSISRSRSRSMSRSRSRSRSPVRSVENRYRDRDGFRQRGRQYSPPRQPAPPPAAPRERSLSPFSKRLALTQAMNMGR